MIINSENFKSTIESNDVVVVDFMASWCGPCKMLSPVIDSLSADFNGESENSVMVGKCDVDESSDIAIQYDVRSVPSIVFFKNGVVAHRMVGAQTKSAIKTQIDKLV